MVLSTTAGVWSHGSVHTAGHTAGSGSVAAFYHNRYLHGFVAKHTIAMGAGTGDDSPAPAGSLIDHMSNETWV